MIWSFGLESQKKVSFCTFDKRSSTEIVDKSKEKCKNNPLGKLPFWHFLCPWIEISCQQRRSCFDYFLDVFFDDLRLTHTTHTHTHTHMHLQSTVILLRVIWVRASVLTLGKTRKKFLLFLTECGAEYLHQETRMTWGIGIVLSSNFSQISNA